MKYGNTNYPTDKMEVRKMLLHITNKVIPCNMYRIYSKLHSRQITYAADFVNTN